MPYVFVYGTLKRGYHNNYLLESSRFVGTAVTIGDFSMRCVGFPHIVRDAQHGHSVAGEVYKVSAATMQQLDRLEGEGRMYRREHALVRLADGTDLDAYVYVAMEPLAERGDPVAPTNDVLVWEGGR